MSNSVTYELGALDDDTIIETYYYENRKMIETYCSEGADVSGMYAHPGEIDIVITHRDSDSVHFAERVSDPEIKFYLSPQSFNQELRRCCRWNIKTLYKGILRDLGEIDIPVDDKIYSSLDAIGDSHEGNGSRVYVRQTRRLDPQGSQDPRSLQAV